MKCSRWQSPMYDGGTCNILPHETDELLRRIVALLNATELSSDAVAALQYLVMNARASFEQDAPLDLIDMNNAGCTVELLDSLTDALNHTVRMYVELDEEPSIALDGGAK